MINLNKNVFHINTANSSYIFCINNHNDLQHLYYGKKIGLCNNYDAFFPKRSVLLVNGLFIEGDVTYGIDDIAYEYSFEHRGDMRECSLGLDSDDNNVFSFKYDHYSIGEKPSDSNIAMSYGYDDSLKIVLKDEVRDVYLNLWYLVFENCDVITRFVELKNNSNTLFIDKLMSAQLDFLRTDLKLLTFDGAWGRERYKNERVLTSGKHVNESLSGASSNRHNPFIILADRNSENNNGECFGVNIIYSGNHYESVEVSPFENTRLLCGINPTNFRWELEKNNTFTTPEAVLSYSELGYNNLSLNFHHFIKEHIIRGYWKDKPKPLLVNSWEAMYFNITKDKILNLADSAVECGLELLVIDDGWFGARNDDTTSLGDWVVNKEKFPNGLIEIADKIHEKGLLFGLWFEPEMISEKSDLYALHPDWALKCCGITKVLGRNQHILDLSNMAVQNYIISCVSGIIMDNNIDYVKWDFNRTFSDLTSNAFKSSELLHRYILGLYRVQSEITKKCEKVLFEFCASGGNRFDLGMMCFSPIGWTSDNTDVLARSYVQEGTSFGYPQSVMCNHISNIPNHQTKRNSKFKDRATLAMFGVLGCQLDLTKLNKEDTDTLKAVVEKYKKIRSLVNNGDFYRLIDGFNSNYNSWSIVNRQKDEAILILHQKLFYPVCPTTKIKLLGLNDSFNYEINEVVFDDSKPFSLEANGEVLKNFGFVFPQNYQGNEVQSETRIMTDFSTVVYHLRKKV